MHYSFSKWQGCGNDFVIINAIDNSVEINGNVAKRICDRHFGVGADGVIIIQPSTIADFKMRIINSDGSEPEMCGNGVRCVAKFAYKNAITTNTTVQVETLAGIVVPQLVVSNDECSMVKVDMGEPVLYSNSIPVSVDSEEFIDNEIDINGIVIKATCVSMGNPHCVVFCDEDEIDTTMVKQWGPLIETHNIFPQKTNVEFLKCYTDSDVQMKVWERGAGMTLACGTGASAAVVAGIITGRLKRQVTVKVDGGELLVNWAENNHVYLTGPAEHVYDGYIKI